MTFFLLISPGRSIAEDSTGVFSGFAAWQEGQLVKYWYQGVERKRQWMTGGILNLNYTYALNDRVTLIAGAEGRLMFDMFPASLVRYPDANNSYPVNTIKLYHAEACIGLGDLGSVSFGYFPFKYNPNVRNLGEYLFRSGTYPAYLINEFDFPKAFLTGMRVNVNLFNMLENTLLFTAETEMRPYHDFSLAYIFNFSGIPSLDIGGGISLSHLFSVNDSITAPNDRRTQYVKNGDTSYYTFSGTKLMARFCFDPKKLFPFEIFGEEDLKFYAEAAIIGLKGYPANPENIFGYDTLLQKMPIAMGFNVPVFRVLDLLNVEVEWFGSKNPNDFCMVDQFGLPIPRKSDGGTSTELPREHNYATDNWKWSVQARRTIIKNISLIGQFANDHTRIYSSLEQNKEREETLLRGDWYWMLKAECKF